MNKKFIVVSLGILLSTFILLGLSNCIFKNNFTYSDSSEDKYNNMKAIIIYDGFTETEDGYEIKFKLKNNCKYIALIKDVKLSFDGTINSMEFIGIDERARNGNYISGVNTEESVGYIFRIPKGVYFDKSLININNMNVSYNIDFYRYRIGKNTLFMTVGSVSDIVFIQKNLNTDVLYK